MRSLRNYSELGALCRVGVVAVAILIDSLAAQEVPSGEITIEDLVNNPPQADLSELSVLQNLREARSTYVGHVRWELPKADAELLCDRLFVHRILRQEDTDDAVGEGGDPAGRKLEFYIYADGNVRLRLRRQKSTIEGEWILYERFGDESQQLTIHGGRVLTTISGMKRVMSLVEERDVRNTEPLPRGRRDFDRLPLAFSADVLWTTDLRRFHAEGMRISTCDYEVPHFAISAKSAEVEPVQGEEERPEGPADGDGDGDRDGDGDEGSDFTIEFEDGYFELEEKGIVPLPVSYWDTRWHDFFPLREVIAGHSSKYGTTIGGVWNVNFFLKQLSIDKIRHIGPFLRRSRLDFETTYFSRRGFGYGPKAEYGNDASGWLPWQKQNHEWNYYGEGRYFAIRDSGDDRSSSIDFQDPNRYWGNFNHRQAIPYVGTLDVEYSEYSDQNFLREYFERIFKQEKQQENLFLLRRNLADNMAVTGLYKYRRNDFLTVVERLPEAKFFLFQQPVFESGLYTDLSVQAANIRIRPPASSMSPSQRVGRFDTLNEWAFPLNFGRYVDIRPFATLRYTGYDEVADPALGAEDRGSVGGGISASQQWSRTFDSSESVLDHWFEIDRLKHVVVPKVTYFNLFMNDLDSTRTIGVDEVDAVDLEESVALSLRQAFMTRRPVSGTPRKAQPLLGGRDDLLDVAEYRTGSVLDSEVSFVVFPRHRRDNGGDPLSLMIFDNTVRPGDHLYLRAWVASDVNDGFRVSKTDVSLTVDWVPDVLTTTVGDRFTRRPTSPNGSNNFIYTFVSVQFGPKWRFQTYYSHDIEQGRDSEVSVALVRVLHRFAVIFEYSVDPGEDYNHSVSVNFAPLQMIGGLRRRLDR